MFISDDLGLDLEDDFNEEKSSSYSKLYTSLSEETIIPRKGNFLGLDISQNSSGICIYRDGVKSLFNSFVVYDKSNPHAESSIRFQLKRDLLEVIGDTELDVVVIEDVFEGSNAEVVRKLYALNTAIDDLILEGKIRCKDFVRVSNNTWKSWLSVVDTNNTYRGYKDKEKIQGYLSMIGITDEGEGFQDRLDATGMLIGYFLKYLNGGKDSELNKVKKKLNISMNDIICDFEPDIDLIKMNAAYEDEDVNVVIISDTRISKKMILNYISGDISSVYITGNPVRLGLMADTLNLALLRDNEKGYFGFWLSNKSKEKYRKKLDRNGIKEITNDK